MIRRKNFLGALLVLFNVQLCSMAPESSSEIVETELKKTATDVKRLAPSATSKLIEFKFDQKNLKDLVSEYAEKLNINILYPETEPIATKVTFDAGRYITLSEAWDFIGMILDQAGFALIIRCPGAYTLISNAKIFGESLPIYIGTDYNLLPDSVQRIRFVYYFRTLQLSTKHLADLKSILSNMFPASPELLALQLVLDPNSNSMILSMRSDMVKSIMQVISVFDQQGAQESVEVLKLDHAKAVEVVTILNSLIEGGSKPIVGPGRAKYFAESVKVLNLEPKDSKMSRPLNSIIIMGKAEDVEGIKAFVKKYLDVVLEDGKSFYHVIELQYLTASKFKDVLSDLVKGNFAGGGSGQSTSTLASDLGFDPQIKIVSETITGGSGMSLSGAGSASASTTQTIQRGGNNLVIACSSRDWERIESLIKKLDVPQKQVIIEALVMDLGVTFAKGIGSQLRTRGLAPTIFPKNMQAQAGLMINSIIENPGGTGNADSYSLLGDLSNILNPEGLENSGGGSLISPQTSTSLTPAGTSGSSAFTNGGSTLFMINGGKARTNGVWAFFQLLSNHTASKVFTRPVIMVVNGQTATVSYIGTKNLPGTSSGTVSPTISYKQEPVTVTIDFTPLISDNNMVNLQIKADLSTWTDPNNATDGTKNVRNLTTNVSMLSGDLLILGGLITDNTTLSKKSIPFFERIPVIGNIFAARSKTNAKNQLFILVRTTVVTPREDGGMNKITKSAAKFAVDQLADYEDSFANLKDPITRWFFNSDHKNESDSELLSHKIENLHKSDFGYSEELDRQFIPKKDDKKQLEEMKVGWFSDNQMKNKSSAQPEDTDKLADFLKDMENPFEKRLNI